ncbi:hypothetical protein [Pseudomonas sp. S2_B07]
MPTENKPAEPLPEVIRYIVNHSDRSERMVLASDYDAAQSELAALREELAELKALGPLPELGAYGVELSTQKWESIYQHAFELGGTNGGEFLLDESDINELISFSVELMRPQPTES